VELCVYLALGGSKRVISILIIGKVRVLKEELIIGGEGFE